MRKTILIVLMLNIAACESRSVQQAEPRPEAEEAIQFNATSRTQVDLLFVIDNSGSMEVHQKSLKDNFHKLIEALSSQKLGGLPDLRIGVVSTDVGALGTSSAGFLHCHNDDGKLQTTPRASSNCATPADPWIDYDRQTDQTNVPKCQEGKRCVKEAFSCIAELGTEGCAFEAPLEAARRALDPKHGTNAGFLRPDAILAVVFITDEDDCSLSNPEVFQAPDDAYGRWGMLKSYRCFQAAFSCDQPPHQLGPRQNCVERSGYAHPVRAYIDFFKSLKRASNRVVLAAIAGAVSPLRVVDEGGTPRLGPSCVLPIAGQKKHPYAVPPLRVAKVVEALGGRLHSICTHDFGPALTAIGEQIRLAQTSHCLRLPPKTADNELACLAGDIPGQATTCAANTLASAQCEVTDIRTDDRGTARRTIIARCSEDVFRTGAECGDQCPCWRLVKDEKCELGPQGVPYKVEVLREAEPAGALTVQARCRSSAYRWGSPELDKSLTGESNSGRI